MSHHFLPKLRDNNRVPNIEEPGTWEHYTTAVLELIGDGLDTAVDPKYFDVDSIPDVWARPLFFEMALYDEKNPLHEKIVGEWRGLAAMIALSEWDHSYEMRSKHVKLDDSSVDFANIAMRLAPQKSISSDTEWTQLNVLYYNDRPIGLTSPTTLFATAVQYRAQGLEWFNGRFLTDPLRFETQSGKKEDVLNEREKEAIAYWLDCLESNLDSHSEIVRDDTWNHLLGVLHAFQDDLGVSPRTSLGVRENALGITTTGIFNYLDTVPKRPYADPEDSEVRLIATRDDCDNEKALLLLSMDIAEQWHRKPKEIAVWGVHTLQDTRHVSGPCDQLLGTSLNGAEWRRAEAFFTDQLYILRGVDVFNPDTVWRLDGHEQVDGDPIPPITPELLRYYGPRELANRIEIGKRGSGKHVKYVIWLTLQLSGPDGAGREVTLKKVYDRSATVYWDDIPILEIWPNFLSNYCNTYYGFFDGGNSFYGEPLPRPSKRREKEMGHEAIGRAHYEMRKYPEAFPCKSSRDKQDAGLLLLKKPRTVSATGHKWRVGVDFGTTNTTVYVESHGRVWQMVFGDRLGSISLPPEQQRLREVNSMFFPPCNQDVPFPTLYHRFDSTRNTSYDNQAIETVLDGHVLYINENSYKYYKGSGFSEGQIYADIKWSKDPFDRKLIRSFLEQIVLQVRAEAATEGVGKIDWYYSIPTSFSKRQRARMRTIWGDLVDSEKVNEHTESLCTAAYFLETKGASMAEGAICIDIGGASADIAIWQNLDMQLQASLLLAGREIFTSTILAEKKSFKPIFPEGNLPDSTSKLEAILAREEKKLLKEYFVHKDLKPAKTLRFRIILGISFLLYYSGLLVRHLIDNGYFENESRLPNLYFGGNGSKMFHWLESGRFTVTSDLSELFAKVLAKATRLDKKEITIELTPSSAMKHEVAYGLVTDTKLNVSTEASVLAGENFRNKQGDRMGWNIELTAEYFSSVLKVDDLSELRKVFDLVNEFAISDASDDVNIDALDDSTIDKIFTESKSQLANYLEEVARQDKDEIDVQPLFVLGARKILRVMTKMGV